MSNALAALLALVVVQAAGPRPPAAGPPNADGSVPEPRLHWTARWISAPDAPAQAYAVVHFRRSFKLAARPQRFVVHASGDQRYRLFVNGRSAAAGPARGDLETWRYETVDLAPLLRAGDNVVAAVVWNYAEHAPLAQISHRTGFLLQGDTDVEQRLVDTGSSSSSSSWKALRDEAYEPIPFNSGNMKAYFVTGPGDRVRGAAYPWGWQEVGFDDAAWPAAQATGPAHARDGNTAGFERLLVPRGIPLMEEKPERLASVRRSEGSTPPRGFPSQSVAWKIPARARVQALLDQGYLTTAYPEVIVSGGRGASVELAYAENLWGPGERDKGHRDQVDGKQFRGNHDTFLPDGRVRRRFAPLWWRTYRFVQMTIETGDEPLTVEDVRGIYTGYPFQRRARFSADSTELERILDVGWRTARLCAHETYVDCPYYEQLQYAGDTRVQALVSLFMTGDDRLMRNAIRQFDDSRTGSQLPKSRYPTRVGQYIPTFALLWIGMLHDHWWYRDDGALVRQMLPGVRAVLGFFRARQRPDGALGPLPYWNFVDWVPGWPSGTAPGFNRSPFGKPEPGRPEASDPLGTSSLLDLHLVLALRWAAELERAHGDVAQGQQDAAEANRIADRARALYWDPERRLYADTAARQQFSQHANVLAVLAELVPQSEAGPLLERVLSDPSLAPASIYFRYYLHVALAKAGLAERYLEQLGPWRRMLALGLTTWAETEDPSRSECHAWGASPNIELFRTVLGIDAAAPGWRKVILRPALGPLTRAHGAVPHPAGEVGASYVLKDGALEATVELPAGIEGELSWRGERRALAPGRSRVVVRPARR